MKSIREQMRNAMNGVPTKHKMNLLIYGDSTFVVDNNILVRDFMYDPTLEYRPCLHIFVLCTVWGTWLAGIHERNTMAIVECNVTREYHAVPLFTDTSMLFSHIVRKDWSIARVVGYGTLVTKNHKWEPLNLGTSRYVRFARTGEGFTGVFELVKAGWVPCAYLYNTNAEILQMEIQAVGADLVDSRKENCIREYNCSRQAYQVILDSCIFMNKKTYPK